MLNTRHFDFCCVCCRGRRYSLRTTLPHRVVTVLSFGHNNNSLSETADNVYLHAKNMVQMMQTLSRPEDLLLLLVSSVSYCRASRGGVLLLLLQQLLLWVGKRQELPVSQWSAKTQETFPHTRELPSAGGDIERWSSS